MPPFFRGLRLTVVGITVAALASSIAAAPAESASSETRLAKFLEPAKVRAECQRLHALGPHCLGGYQPLNAFIDKLAKTRDDGALRLIVTEELPGVNHAARCYVKLLGPSNGVRFARTLNPCSRGWRASIWTLSFSNRSEIKAYIRELIRSGGAWQRGFGYEIDFCRGWGDLVKPAWGDLESTDRLYEGFWADGTLGDAAREYLERFEKKRLIPPGKAKEPLPIDF